MSTHRLNITRTSPRRLIGISRSTAAPADDSEQMVPLINVVFLLMIFFLLAGTIGRRDAVPIDPPEAATERQRDRGAIRISLLPSGELMLDDMRGELTAIVASLRQRFDSQTESRRMRIEIRADAAVPARDLKQLLEALADLGADQITLMTRGR